MGKPPHVMLRLTHEELWALGASAIYAACNLSDPLARTPADEQGQLILNGRAVALIQASGIDPTQLKDLGLSLVAKANAHG